VSHQRAEEAALLAPLAGRIYEHGPQQNANPLVPITQTGDRMRPTYLLALLLPAAPLHGQTAARLDTVLIPSGPLKLHALVWHPGTPGRHPAVLFNHGLNKNVQTPAQVAQAFTDHGYVFVFPFRRGHGLSADQGLFMGDALEAATKRGGEAARDTAMVHELESDEISDVLAALDYLKKLPDVDSGRVVIAGHSLGGVLSVLASQRELGIRAVVTFAAGAGNWDRSPLLQERMRYAAAHARVPVFFIHAANDHSTQPAEVLAAEMQRSNKPFEKKIFPAYGSTPQQGHAFAMVAPGVWQSDVFRFLDRHVAER
jgi:carboxymethylenebutenolidase